MQYPARAKLYDAASSANTYVSQLVACSVNSNCERSFASPPVRTRESSATIMQSTLRHCSHQQTSRTSDLLGPELQSRWQAALLKTLSSSHTGSSACTFSCCRLQQADQLLEGHLSKFCTRGCCRAASLLLQPQPTLEGFSWQHAVSHTLVHGCEQQQQ